MPEARLLMVDDEVLEAIEAQTYAEPIEAHLDIDEAHQDDPDERITAPCCADEGETE